MRRRKPVISFYRSMFL